MPQERDEAKPVYWYVALTLGVVAFALGIIAYIFEDGWTARTFYEAVQVVLLNAEPVHNGHPFRWLNAAQIAAAIAWLAFGVGTADYVWKRVRTRSGLFMRGHIIVLGKGETARSVLPNSKSGGLLRLSKICRATGSRCRAPPN